MKKISLLAIAIIFAASQIKTAQTPSSASSVDPNPTVSTNPANADASGVKNDAIVAANSGASQAQPVKTKKNNNMDEITALKNYISKLQNDFKKIASNLTELKSHYENAVKMRKAPASTLKTTNNAITTSYKTSKKSVENANHQIKKLNSLLANVTSVSSDAASKTTTNVSTARTNTTAMEAMKAMNAMTAAKNAAVANPNSNVAKQA